jgi:hypothetical protein
VSVEGLGIQNVRKKRRGEGRREGREARKRKREESSEALMLASKRWEQDEGERGGGEGDLWGRQGEVGDGCRYLDSIDGGRHREVPLM